MLTWNIFSVTRCAQVIPASSVSLKLILMIVLQNIDEILNGWKGIHKNAQHGLALWCKVRKMNTIEIIDIPSVLEKLSVVLEIEMETILLVVVYLILGLFGTFIDDLISTISELSAQYRTQIDGYVNLDQMLHTIVTRIEPLIQNFNLSQRSQYSTHIHGGIFNLVFDTSNSNAVSSLSLAYNDHFVLFFQI